MADTALGFEFYLDVMIETETKTDIKSYCASSVTSTAGPTTFQSTQGRLKVGG
jgi:hypothetical protein